MPVRKAKPQIKKYYEAIPVGKLLVDESLDAQRIFQPAWADKLEKIWNPDLVLAATVSRRPDGDYVLDGQHSNEVARRQAGEDFLRDCMVYEGLTTEMEAKLFLAANRDRKPVKPYDNFRVMLTAGDELAKQVNDEVRSVGLEVSNGTSTNRVGAVQALLYIAGRRPGLVARVLTVAEKAWGRDSSAWDNMMLRAIAMVLHLNWDKCDDKRLKTTLEKAPVGRWKANAIGATTAGGGSASRSTPLAGNIVTVYNKGLRSTTSMLVAP